MVRKDEELTRIEYLGQRLATQKPELRDYALCSNAEKIAVLDILIQHTSGKQRKILKNVREILLRLGEAQYIMNADVFTNLTIKVGSTIKKVSFGEEK